MRGSKALLVLSSLVVHIDIDVVLLRRVESRLYLWVSVSTLSMSTWVCRSIMYVLLYIVYILCGVWWLRVLHRLSVLELLCMIRYVSFIMDMKGCPWWIYTYISEFVFESIYYVLQLYYIVWWLRVSDWSSVP